MITSIEQLHVGMNVRTKYGAKTWRVAAVDSSGWVMLDLMVRSHRQSRRFIHETEINQGRLIQVEED